MLSVSDILISVVFCSLFIIWEWKTVIFFVRNGRLPEKEIETLIDGKVKAGRYFVLPMSILWLMILFVYLIVNWAEIWSNF